MKDQVRRIKANRSESKTILGSIIDQALSRVAVSVLFFYRSSIPAERLMSTLSEVLSDYPAFAGSPQISAGRLTLVLDNEGAGFCQASSERTIKQVMPDIVHGAGKDLVLALNPAKVLKGHQPPLTIKITYFACGGMSIGACWHHGVGDMHSFMHFFRAWAATLSDGQYEKPLEVVDRDLYLEKSLPKVANVKPGFRCLGVTELLRFAVYMLFGAKDQQTVQVFFSDQELVSMKHHYSPKGTMLSANDVICAHMYSLIAASDQKRKKRFLSVAIDYRRRVGMPENLMGNILSSINLELEPGVDTRSIALALRRAVNNFDDNHMDYHVNRQLIAELGGYKAINRIIPIALDPMNGNLLVTDWRKQGVYDVVMGNEAPFYFTAVPEVPFPWGSVLVEGPEGEGVLYTATLPSRVARALISKSTDSIHTFGGRNDIKAESGGFL